MDGTQPILGAIDSTAAHREGYSPRYSCTRRTARSRTSDENRLDLFTAPFSQRLEPPPNPGRFTLQRFPGKVKYAAALLQNPAPSASVPVPCGAVYSLPPARPLRSRDTYRLPTTGFDIQLAMSPGALKSAVKPLQGESLRQYQLDRFDPCQRRFKTDTLLQRTPI